jgi:hypothetical protein
MGETDVSGIGSSASQTTVSRLRRTVQRMEGFQAMNNIVQWSRIKFIRDSQQTDSSVGVWWMRRLEVDSGLETKAD